jgi:hypothetical protein
MQSRATSTNKQKSACRHSPSMKQRTSLTIKRPASAAIHSHDPAATPRQKNVAINCKVAVSIILFSLKHYPQNRTNSHNARLSCLCVSSSCVLPARLLVDQVTPTCAVPGVNGVAGEDKAACPGEKGGKPLARGWASPYAVGWGE